ncbi:MAG: hypothetical protein IKD66_15420 [Solobacterium sp.]|nr:hypothetical protein [Solobacterium sp.]
MTTENRSEIESVREDIQLLRRLSEENRKAVTHRRIIAYAELAILILLVIAFFLIVPRMLNLMTAMEETLVKINSVTEQAEPVVESFSKLDFEGLSDSINKLNAAADQLSNFVNSFSGITGLFGR